MLRVIEFAHKVIKDKVSKNDIIVEGIDAIFTFIKNT